MNEVQLRLADLAALGLELVRRRGNTVNPVVAPLPPVVYGDLEVEAVCFDALRVHFVNDCVADAVGDNEIAVVRKPEPAEIIECHYLLDFRHARFNSNPVSYSDNRHETVAYLWVDGGT